MSSFTDVIIFPSKSWWPGTLFLLSNLNAFSNSSSHKTPSFNVVLTVGRYELKIKSHWGILLARFGSMLTKNSLNYSAIAFASCISI